MADFANAAPGQNLAFPDSGGGEGESLYNRSLLTTDPEKTISPGFTRGVQEIQKMLDAQKAAKQIKARGGM